MRRHHRPPRRQHPTILLPVACATSDPALIEATRQAATLSLLDRLADRGVDHGPVTSVVYDVDHRDEVVPLLDPHPAAAMLLWFDDHPEASVVVAQASIR